jgi:hypothetical protein
MRMSVPLSRRWVAKLWRSVCTVTCLAAPAAAQAERQAACNTCQTPRVLTNLEAWIRRRLRLYLWRQWRNGRMAPTASRNCGAVACRSSTRRLPPARRPGSGACQDIRRSNRRCAIRLRRPRSPPPLYSCPSLTRSNRQVRDPYARWWGRGGTARCPPIPINPLSFTHAIPSTRTSIRRSRSNP